MATRVLIPAGALGLGFDEAALRRAVATGPDIIAVDGGSTDSGPHYLGTGTSKYSRAGTKAEWKLLMEARAQAGVPLLIGTAGTCGTDAMVDWMAGITREIAAELGQSVKLARLYSEQDPAAMQAALRAGRIRPLWPEQPLDEAVLGACSHIVALAGAEQIAAALGSGADIVIAGRCTDTAVIAALPLMRGEHAGAAWHGAKIGECGATCTTDPTSGVIVIDFDASGFTVRPMAEGVRATPDLVAAHMLYENADPNILHEPGGALDVRNATYAQATETAVRVEGAAWRPAPWSVKLEGARLAGYQSCALVLLRDPAHVAHAREWCAKLEARLHEEIPARLGLGRGEYHIELRRIGESATLGHLETAPANPAEIGVLLIATAPDQASAHEIARLANPHLLHMPLASHAPQATHAFPFSPPEWDRGPLHEFCLNHVLACDDPMAPFRIETEEIRHAPA